MVGHCLKYCDGRARRRIGRPQAGERKSHPHFRPPARRVPGSSWLQAPHLRTALLRPRLHSAPSLNTAHCARCATRSNPAPQPLDATDGDGADGSLRRIRTSAPRDSEADRQTWVSFLLTLFPRGSLAGALDAWSITRLRSPTSHVTRRSTWSFVLFPLVQNACNAAVR